jgi:hypothetical protein
MNTTSQTENTTSRSNSFAYSSYSSNFVIDIIGYLYLMPIVCIIGLMLNALSLLTMASMKSSDNLTLYRLMITRTISDMGLLLIGALTPISTCQNCLARAPLVSLIFNLYFADFGSNFFQTFSTLADILIVHCRLCSLVDTCCLCRRFSKPSYKAQVLCILFIGGSFHTPKLFTRAIVVVNSPINNATTILTMGFFAYVNRNAFNIYFIFVAVVQNLFTLFVLVVLNVLLLWQFRRYIVQSNSIRDTIRIRKSEQNLTKMVLSSSLLFATSHAAQCITAIIYRLVSFGVLKYNLAVSVWIYGSYMITYGALSVTILTYVYYNRGFAIQLTQIMRNALEFVVGRSVTISSQVN